jgi:anti-anti-sigma factor
MTAIDHQGPSGPPTAPSSVSPSGDSLLVIDVREAEGGNLAVIKLAGEIDLHTRHRLLDAIAGLKDQSALVIDMSDVGFMDSAGLHVLIDARRRVEVTVRDAKPFVHRLFEISGLLDHFVFDGSTADPVGPTDAP